MTLQDAAAARTAADLRNPIDYNSVTMGELNTLISTSDGEVVLTLTTEGENGSLEIVQTDSSKIDLSDFIDAVKSKDYDVSHVLLPNQVTIFVRF